VVHNGIDAAPFDAVTPDEIGAVRDELNLPETGVVGVFSRLAEWKGQHVLLEALRDLPNVTALIVGDALFPEDRAYADRLRRTIQDDGLGSRVRMTGFREDVPVLMHACDVIVHTSTAPEPFGRVIVEGMLAGRPVIATNIGGPAEVLNHGETGYLVPPGDAQTLADVLRTLTAPGSSEGTTIRIDVQQVVDAGSSMARARFSVDRMQNGIEECVAACVGGSRQPVS
jgi:glycosyltransferase involved in cell wall biosynthesis